MAQAPISVHLDLFRYWDAKRGGRAMPARADMVLAEMGGALFPYVTIIDRVDGRFRYRLVGVGVVNDLGKDFTDGWVGSYTNAPDYAAAVISVYWRMFALGRPRFTSGEHRTETGLVQSNSRLLLPLSDDGVEVDMVIFSRVARFNPNLRVGMDWFKGAPGRICSEVDVTTAEDISTLCSDWERDCL